MHTGVYSLVPADFTLFIHSYPTVLGRWPNSPRVWVTKAPFVNVSVSKIFDLARVPFGFFESLSYLTGTPSDNSDTAGILSCSELIKKHLWELSTRRVLYENWYYYAKRNKYGKCIICDKWNENCENVTASLLTDRRIVFPMQASQLRQQSSAL